MRLEPSEGWPCFNLALAKASAFRFEIEYTSLMLWLLVLLIIVVGVAGLYIGIDWVWQPPIPPPQPVPLITSAVGTSSQTVRLTLSKTPGQVMVERYWPYDGSTFDFPTTQNEVVDSGLVSGAQYRARYTSSPTAPWSVSKPEWGIEATTLTEVLEGELTLPDSDWEGFCLVQRFEAGALFKSGDLVSITLRASSAGASIDRIYISQAVDPGPGIDPYDSVEYRATMQDTAFKPPLVIPPAPPNQTNTVTVPAILYTLDNTKPLLIAVDFSATPASGIMYREVPAEKAVAYFKLQGPLQQGEEPEARKTDRSGYTRYPADPTNPPRRGGIYLIERIEVG